MTDLVTINVTLPTDMAAAMDSAVEAGDYTSASDLVGAALRDWKHRREQLSQSFDELKADIDEGLADIASGRIVDFDVRRIAENGRKRLGSRSPSV